MARFREDETRQSEGIPALDNLEPGQVCGAVLPMSAVALTQLRNHVSQLRDRIEVAEYLLYREQVVYS